MRIISEPVEYADPDEDVIANFAPNVWNQIPNTRWQVMAMKDGQLCIKLNPFDSWENKEIQLTPYRDEILVTE